MSGIICLTLILNCCMATQAAYIPKNHHSEDSSITPYWNNIVKIGNKLTISSTGLAELTCYITCRPENTSKVKIQANLQQFRNGQWCTIKTFVTERNSKNVVLNENYHVSKGYDYRISAIFTAYSGVQTERTNSISNIYSY